MIAVIAACDIGAKVSAQSKRLMWHFNAVDRPEIQRYANRLHRSDHAHIDRHFTSDRTGDLTRPVSRQACESDPSDKHTVHAS